MTRIRSKVVDRPGVDREGRTPLHYAASDGNHALCKELLEGGADPNAQDDKGWVPLHFAAQGSSAESVIVLLAAGAKPDVTDSNGNTPLSTAVFASRGIGRIIGLLRAAGADPARENIHGISPVGLARKIANYDVAQFFKDLP